MKLFRLALVSLAAAIGSLVSFAQQTQADAFVSSITGSATVLAPGATEAVPLVIGQKLPEGSTVTTGEGANVLIQSHQGIDTGIGANTTAVVGTHSVSTDGVRTAVIDIKQGSAVSVLDPSKRAVNNYAVRTPKGVAAARGTIYTTTVNGTTVTVNTLSGEVSFSIAGGPTISLLAGTTANSGSTASKTIGEAMKDASANEKAALVAAVKLASTVTSIVDLKADEPTSNPAVASAASEKLYDLFLESDPALAAAISDGYNDGRAVAENATVVNNPDGSVQSITAPNPTPGSTTPQSTVDPTIIISPAN